MYVLSGLGAATVPCRLTQSPQGWSCFQGNPAGCAALAAQVVAAAQQPYFALPVPTPPETQLLNWLMNYGYVRADKADWCYLNVAAGDISLYDPTQWGGWAQAACQAAGAAGLSAQCAQVSAEMGKYSVPFATWVKNAAARANGVVLAGRMGSVFDIQSAEFVAPAVDDEIPLGLLGPWAGQLAQAAKAYLAATKAMLLAREGRLGASRNLFVAYAPALGNLPGSLEGLGDTTTFNIPPLPTITIPYPDGKGGTITIGTQNPPPPSQPPAGAPPLKTPEKAGLPSEKTMEWTALVGTGVGILVGVATLYFMLRDKKGTT